MTPGPTPSPPNPATLNPSRMLVLALGGATLDTLPENWLFFSPFCPLGVVEEREKDEGCYRWHDGNPLWDDFGKHQSQGLTLGISRRVRCLDTFGQNCPFVCACVCVCTMLHPGLSPAESLGETEAGYWVAATPWLGVAQQFLESWLFLLLFVFFKCYYLINPTMTGC